MRFITNGVECEFREVRDLLPQKLTDYEAGLRTIVEAWRTYEVSNSSGRIVFDVRDGKLIVRIYLYNSEPAHSLRDVPKFLQVLEQLKDTEEIATLVRLAEIAEVVLCVTKHLK
jgi:Xaa-Pro aminopeptidase